jgi:twinkle protein
MYPEKDQGTFKLNQVLGLAKVAVRRYGIKGLVIDPWNELDHSRPRDLTETEYISKCLTQMRMFAREYGVHVWVVAHPVKMTKNGKGNYNVPRLYDISGSANWYNKADNGITVYRHFGKGVNRVDVHIQKVRFREIGEPGMVQLYYQHIYGGYSEEKNEQPV